MVTYLLNHTHLQWTQISLQSERTWFIWNLQNPIGFHPVVLGMVHVFCPFIFHCFVACFATNVFDCSMVLWIFHHVLWFSLISNRFCKFFLCFCALCHLLLRFFKSLLYLLILSQSLAPPLNKHKAMNIGPAEPLLHHLSFVSLPSNSRGTFCLSVLWLFNYFCMICHVFFDVSSQWECFLDLPQANSLKEHKTHDIGPAVPLLHVLSYIFLFIWFCLQVR